MTYIDRDTGDECDCDCCAINAPYETGPSPNIKYYPYPLITVSGITPIGYTGKQYVEQYPPEDWR